MAPRDRRRRSGRGRSLRRGRSHRWDADGTTTAGRGGNNDDADGTTIYRGGQRDAGGSKRSGRAPPEGHRVVGGHPRAQRGRRRRRVGPRSFKNKRAGPATPICPSVCPSGVGGGPCAPPPPPPPARGSTFCPPPPAPRGEAPTSCVSPAGTHRSAESVPRGGSPRRCHCPSWGGTHTPWRWLCPSLGGSPCRWRG